MGARTSTPATTRWADGLPQPIAFVLSGGAGLGAIQVGMARALAEVAIEPDLVVGTSVGSLNGAVIAEHPRLSDAADRLQTIWQGLRRRDVFVGNALAQGWSVLRSGHLHPLHGLRQLITGSLQSREFAALARPMVVVTADVLTGHVRRFDHGPLVEPLLAAGAIPGVFPPVPIGGHHYADGGPIANVPLMAAVERGAASLVVLDAGDVCHLTELPRGLPDALIGAVHTSMRQRVLIEAPLVARRIPVLYLPRPCADNRSILDLDRSSELVDPARAVVADFLATAPVPTVGAMSGAPHHHEEPSDIDPTPVREWRTS